MRYFLDVAYSIVVVLGLALLCAPKLKSFRLTNRNGELVNWFPQGSRPGSSTLGISFYKWLIFPLAAIYICANLGVFILSWFPANLQDSFPTAPKVVPSYVGPIAGMSCFAAGAVCWLWDRQILSRLLYVLVKGKEDINGLDIYVYFTVIYITFRSSI